MEWDQIAGKKSGKLSLLLILTLALSLGLAASVWAQTMGQGMGQAPAPAMMNLTPDQAGKIFDLMDKFQVDNRDLRRQLMVKHAELAALWKAGGGEQNTIAAKQKELGALRDQMDKKMAACRLECKKIAPNFDMGEGVGMGMGMGAGGMGMGSGAGPTPPAK
jgi:Spy/CpxP family protein refolding chaperone